MTLNRIIFTYWEQGLENAPPIVNMCVERMRAMHPGWELRVLDRSTAQQEFSELPLQSSVLSGLRIPHQSDLLRTHLLIKYGGVWADPTVYFARPLDEWIDEMSSSGLFLFTNPGPDRLISNWFIASKAGNKLLSRQLRLLCSYWSENRFRNLKQRPGRTERILCRALNRNKLFTRFWLKWPVRRLFRLAPYMIYHYQFCEMVSAHRESRLLWQRAGKMNANGPHRLLRHGLLNPVTEAVQQEVDHPRTPLFKLTWKLRSSEVPEGSLLAYLFAKSTKDIALVGPGESCPVT